MRSLCFPGSALALLTVAFAAATPVRADDEKVKFDTVDQVTLQGVYYPSPKGKKAPVVLMLHKIGGNITQDGWPKMAEDLQKAGFAVLQFDFRGHGNSTSVAPGFYNDKVNRDLVKGYTPLKPKETINHKDFLPSYYPQLVNDVAAAKMYLDKRNDGGDCNSSNLVLIGAEDGATLGMSWIYSELHRYRLITPFMKANTSEGTQIAAAIWLSIAPRIGTQPTPLTSWVKFAGDEKNIPMAFIYGTKDQTDTNNAKSLLKAAQGKGGANKWTGEMGIKDTDVKGNGLLSDKLDGRSWITEKYLKKLMEEKSMPAWEERDFKKSYYVWEFNKGQIMGKEGGEDTLRKMPLEVLFAQ